MFSSFGYCSPNPKIAKLTTEKVGWIDDLLIQILLHLPLKPLFRFKTVSKHWNSIISDPKFQLMRNNRAARCLIRQTYDRNSLRMRRFQVFLDRSSNRPRPQIHSIPQTLTIIHSCNGLLLLKNTTSPTYPKYEDYYVYNPTTNKITPTPLLKDEIRARKRDRVIGMHLVFEPSKSPHYKVVCVWGLEWKTSPTHGCQFDVYSSETGSRKRGRHIDVGRVDFSEGVYWNGAIHWVNFFGRSLYYFNPDDEMLRVMPTPLSDVGGRYYLGESFGDLHFAVLLGGPSLPHTGTEVYEMRRDYSEWFLKYKVDDKYTVRRLFCVVRGERDEDDSFLVLGNEKGQILRYNLVHKTCKIMKVLGNEKGQILRYNLVHKTCKIMKVKVKPFLDYNTKYFPYIESPCSV